MNYQRVYDLLIDKAKSRGLDKSKVAEYTEKHHIIPKCLGGGDVSDNLVLLTAREHFIAHWLLSNTYKHDKTHPLHRAFCAMTRTNKGKRTFKNSRGWSIARRRFSELQKGNKLSEQHLQAIRSAAKLRRGKQSPNKGKTFDETTRTNMSKAAVNRSPALNLACCIGKDSEYFHITCLYTFCCENNLNCSNALKVFRGLRRSINGYSIAPI